LEEPKIEGNLSLKVNDGKAATTPIAEALPAEFKREALNGANLAANFAIDLGPAQSLHLTPFKLAALGIALDADVAGSAIIDQPRFQGELKTNTFVPRQLLSQLGIVLPEMADPSVLTKAAFSSRFDAGLDHAELDKLLVQFDQSTLKGSAKVRNFAAPVVRYNLRLDGIDADRYLPPPSEEPAEASTAAEETEAQAAVELPLELMRSLDIDGRLRIGKVKVMNLSSETIDATLKAKAGHFRLHPLSAKLYEGGYSGNLRLDVRSETPKLAMDEKLSGVQAGPLLKDFLGKDYVTGKADVAAKLTTQGLEPDVIKKNLNGNGHFSFDNGQINGLNIGQRIREAYALYKKEPKPSEEQKQTDFSRLSGSFSITNGLVKTRDLSARSPLFQVDGKGQADLVKEKIDMRLDTTIVSDIRDATGRRTGELAGQVIPVTIKGSFSEPKIGVDVASVLKAKVKSAVDEKKREAQQKLEQRKREEQQKLEQQKREAEDKAKQRLDKKKQDLQKKLDDKLKDMLKF
jgi:AsmA protein